MIYDIHVHAHLTDDPLPEAERLMQQGQRLGIDGMLLLGDVLRFGFDADEEHIGKINDHTLQLVDEWPDYFRGLCYLNPGNDPVFLADEIARCLEHEGMAGVKLEVDVNARDARLDPIMADLEQRGAFLLHHAWYKTVGMAFHESTPADIADLAGRWPAVRIVMAHLTAAGHRGVQDIKPHVNVWGDTSGSQPMASIVEYAASELGADRMVYGSDAPGRDFAVQLGRIYGAELAEGDRERILGGNARRLLGI
ncbi:amidohydrolase family protein [Candidatus Latescibacterota bacterium]